MSCLLQKVIKTQKFGIDRALQALLLLIKLDNFTFVFFDDIVHIDMEQRSLRPPWHRSLRLPPGSSLTLSLIANPDRKRMFIVSSVIDALFRSIPRPLLICWKSCFTEHVKLFLLLIYQIHPLNIIVKFLN